jgi:hypothetical protein
VSPAVAPPPSPWDAGLEDASSSSSGGGSSSSGASSGASSGFPNVDGNACQPGSVATYQPGQYRPASGAGQGLCAPIGGSDPITDFYTACLGPNAGTDQCNAVRQQNAACVQCLLTPDTALTYGPLIDHGAFVTANVAGCLELLLPGGLSCARALQQLDGCELAACEANCAVHDAASLADYDSCVSATETGGCRVYATAATCSTAPDASAAAAVCLGDFPSFYAAVAPLFCGLPLDAGAGVDASVE